MIKKEIIHYLKQLNGDEIQEKLDIMNKINSTEIDINEFLCCMGDFTKCISIGIGSLDNDYMTISNTIMMKWIEVIIEQPKIQIKYYDTLILHFLDGLFYALHDRISLYLSHIIELVSVSHVFITRHLSQLLNTIAFHIQTHSSEIIPIITYILKNIEIPELLWNEIVLFLYTLFHFSENISEEMKHQIYELFVFIQEKYTLLSFQYIKSYLSSLDIHDEKFIQFLDVK